MKIAVRVDASVQIGTGHFMRCLALADALKQRGAEVHFISRHLPDYFQDMLIAKRHELTMLDSNPSESVFDDLSHSHWLGTSQDADAQDTVHALSGEVWDWLIVDHYALDSHWESMLRRTAKKILVIDDIADRQHDCDVLLDQNFYADMEVRYNGKVPAHSQLLLGPRYALLRDEFRQLHEQAKPRYGPVKRVLVFFGGIDANNYTERVVEALSEMEVSSLHIDVVIGAQHPCRVQIEVACRRYGFICHVQTDKMAELIAIADLAIGAGGSSSWERCCLGVPTIAICTADNQSKQLQDAASKGLLYAPEIKEWFCPIIKRHVTSLLENNYLRLLISRNGMQAIDGRGTLRVIDRMDCGGVEIRLARLDDSERLFVWRNHPMIRAVSRSHDPIKWEDHSHWFTSVLVDPNRLLLIGERDGVSIGVVRFDILNNEAEVSIYLIPEAKTAVRGRELLQSAEQWCSFNYPEVSAFRADVLGVNERSMHLFLAAGYDVESTSYLKRFYK